MSWARNLAPYDFKKEAVVDVFNNYFGGGMGSWFFKLSGNQKHWLTQPTRL